LAYPSVRGADDTFRQSIVKLELERRATVAAKDAARVYLAKGVALDIPAVRATNANEILVTGAITV
jgi:hypothetical protein